MEISIVGSKQTQESSSVWQYAEDSFKVEKNSVQETLFSLGNGYLGLRGGHEERFEGLRGNTLDGTFINGFYESSPIHHPETAYGFAKEHQFMLNVPNGKGINFSIDGENFDLFQGKLTSYNRSLDFRTGILSRNVEWVSPSGKRVAVTTKRLVSFQRKNIFAIQYEIKALNFSGHITLRSGLDGRVTNKETKDDPRFGSVVGEQPLKLFATKKEQDFLALVHETTNSKLMLISAIKNQLHCSSLSQVTQEQADQKVEQVFEIDIKEGDAISLVKYGAYFTSREHPENELVSLAIHALNEAAKTGFDGLCTEQNIFLTNFWHYADVQISGNDSLQQGMRFNQYHLLQSVGRDGKTSIAAKGLTGEGYGGHYFWDAEIYALPFYLYSNPYIARSMLEYRYTCLDKARQRAREMSHPKGALYAWRTIAGEECSAYFPAGTAQYHINADIAYAIKLYYEATGDIEFIRTRGAEIVLDTARIWMGIGTYVSRKNNQFCINGVTGPDEYTALVDNNFYTNMMAKMHLKFAVDLAAKLKGGFPDDYKRIKETIDLSENEPDQWAAAASAMYLPYDEKLGIHPQDDTFLDKKKWNLAELPPEHHPIFLYYHYLVIYRHQVCKQADVVLALFMFGNRFTPDEKRRDYNYYEAITTHDSSLSPPTFSIMASDVGYYAKAYEYFSTTVRGDLDDLHNNTSHGVHIAAMAGAWMAVVYGFAGMRAYDGELQFAPYLPLKWSSYGFRVYFQGQLLTVEINKNEVRYQLLEGDALQFKHRETLVQLTRANSVKVLELQAIREPDVAIQDIKM